MAEDDSFPRRYLHAKLAEVEAALDRLDAEPDPLAHSDQRRQLAALAAGLTGALARDERTSSLH